CLKCECVYLNHFTTRSQAQNEIFRYIEAFYNLVRPHSAIAWMAPNDFESLISMSSKGTA
ncbi:MAG: IS3 family transposase, partial [Clostridiales bacterium]|nr:IS3 family transposase [Clostridiales bacterium]